jgi:predicted transcriptional regulator of viral defense system
MNRQLSEIGTIPVTTSIIESLYPELQSADKKVIWLEKQGVIIRLKRGLYVVNPEHSGKALSTELIANHLYAPSYISMSTALRYYGLIPEAVYVHQSMTVKHPRNFQTPIGSYDYKYISRKAFPIGVRSVNRGDYAFLIAAPEKALCDLIANSSKVILRYMKEVETYLEQDIRIDMDEFYKMDATIFEDYISVGKKPDSISTLLKFLRR